MARERGEAGVLLVDKPEGPTSHDVVARARKALGVRRVGHAGTLDPFATGLLVILVGSATRLAEYVSASSKVYEARARLGVSTETHDRDGAVVATSEGWRDLDEGAVREAVRSFQGRIEQRPPAFSAKKVRGEAAHRRIRRGERVELAPVEVEIEEIQATRVGLPEVSFRLRCSSGTYVRALARDLGERLGVGAHLTALRRIAVDGFTVEEALPLDRVESSADPWGFVLPPIEAVRRLPRIEVGEEEARRLRQGQAVRLDRGGGGLTAILASGTLIAVAEVEEGVLRPRKVFVG